MDHTSNFPFYPGASVRIEALEGTSGLGEASSQSSGSLSQRGVDQSVELAPQNRNEVKIVTIRTHVVQCKIVTFANNSKSAGRLGPPKETRDLLQYFNVGRRFFLGAKGAFFEMQNCKLLILKCRVHLPYITTRCGGNEIGKR